MAEDPTLKKFELFCCADETPRRVREALAYMERVETFFRAEDARVQERINDELAKTSPDQADNVVESYGWDLHENQFLFPELLRRTMVLSLYTLVEAGLDDLCDEIQSAAGFRLKRSDVHGKGVQRARLYLSKVGEIDFRPIESVWSFICGLNAVRNTIVHADGCLSVDCEAKVNKFVAAQAELRGEPGSSLVIEPGFAPLVAQRAEELFVFLGKEAPRLVT